MGKSERGGEWKEGREEDKSGQRRATIVWWSLHPCVYVNRLGVRCCRVWDEKFHEEELTLRRELSRARAAERKGNGKHSDRVDASVTRRCVNKAGSGETFYFTIILQRDESTFPTGSLTLDRSLDGNDRDPLGLLAISRKNSWNSSLGDKPSGTVWMLRRFFYADVGHLLAERIDALRDIPTLWLWFSVWSYPTNCTLSA